jgi:hypothetical protein
MNRPSVFLAAALLLGAGALLAQDNGIRRGKIKRVDPDRPAVTLTTDGADRDYVVAETTRVFGHENRPLKERVRALKVGADVLFKAEKRGGKDVLVGIRPVEAAARPAPRKFDASHLRPLTELGNEKYQGFPGGLYPGGNTRPPDHERAGLDLARRVRPLDADGRPSPDGKIVVLSIGMSNTAQASQGFARLLASDADRDPHVVFVNGAQGGMTARIIQDVGEDAPGVRYWTTVGQRLRSAGVTADQVQAIWIKQADAGPTQGFPRYAETLRDELANIVRLLPDRFPNAKLAYLSSRTYGGYARTALNPEPYAYESGFAVRWLIEQQLKGDPELNYDPARGKVRAPWLSWGPYLWANGMTKRADGFFYAATDFANDGTHHSAAGQQKVGGELLRFFKTDPTTRPWFVRTK